MSIQNATNIEINFTPWLDDSHYKLITLQLVESLGGQLAHGRITMWHDYSDDALKMVTEQRTGKLTIKDAKTEGTGIIYDSIPIFVTSRQFYKHTLDLTFLCIPSINFIEDPISSSYDDITSALKSAYPGTVDIRTKQDDKNNGIRIFRLCETGYDFCTRLAYSFKENTVFSFSWSGLMIKDLCGSTNSRGDIESKDNPPIKLNALALMNYDSKYDLTYDADLEYLPINPWEESDNYRDHQFMNARALSDYDKYYICKAENYNMLENYRINKNMMEAEMYYNLRITGPDFPGYKIGDVIKFTSPEQAGSYPFEVFIVASNELFFASTDSDILSPHGLTFEWTSKLYGLNKGKWAEKED